MKRTIIGVALLVSAAMADIGVTISASILAAGLTSWGSSGKFWTAIMENGFLFPFILAKLLFLLAILILGKEYFSKAAK